MVYTVYVIEDETGKRYTGYTNNLERRLWEHNNKVTKSTKSGKSWQLRYSEGYSIKSEAIKRERFFKTGKGREFLQNQCRVV